MPGSANCLIMIHVYWAVRAYTCLESTSSRILSNFWPTHTSGVGLYSYLKWLCQLQMCTYPHFPPIQVGTVQRRVSRTGLPSNSQCLPRHCSWCISHRWMHGQYRYWLDPGLYSNLYNILDGIANIITIHKWYYMWCWVPSHYVCATNETLVVTAS